MNCYYCLIETGTVSRSAFAICQRCGAGICEAHLVTFGSTPGMAGGCSQKFLCSHCTYPAHRRVHVYNQMNEHQRNEKKWRLSWWRWFRKDQEEALPEPEHVITAIEHFLKYERHE